MAHQVIWAPSARLDLKDLVSYIAESRPTSSVRFAKQIFQTVSDLTTFPEMGRIVPEFNDAAIREVIRRPCRIVYRVKPQEHIVEIVRIWHAARGTPEL